MTGVTTVPDSSAGQLVLLVDDEPALLLAFERLLARPGRTIDTADCFAAAEALLQTKTYDVVITDFQLAGNGPPGPDGLELIRRLRLRELPTRSVLMTAYGGPQLAAQAADLGVDAYIDKPVTGRQLRKIVEQLTAPSAASPRRLT